MATINRCDKCGVCSDQVKGMRSLGSSFWLESRNIHITFNNLEIEGKAGPGEGYYYKDVCRKCFGVLVSRYFYEIAELLHEHAPDIRIDDSTAPPPGRRMLKA